MRVIASYSLLKNQIQLWWIRFFFELKLCTHSCEFRILGKSGLFMTPPLEDCLTGLKGSSTLLKWFKPVKIVFFPFSGQFIKFFQIQDCSHFCKSIVHRRNIYWVFGANFVLNLKFNFQPNGPVFVIFLWAFNAKGIPIETVEIVNH